MALASGASLITTSAHASQDSLPDDLRQTISTAAEGQQINDFSAALRSAIAAAPDQKQTILRHAMTLRPDWAAELMLTALFDPALESRNERAPSAGLVVPSQAPVEPLTGRQTAETPPGPEDEAEKSPWSGNIDVGGVARSGNTENAGVSAGAEVVYEAAPWKHLASASFDYLRTRSETEAQAFEAEYQLHYDLTERTFVYGLAHYDDDRFSGFDYEFTSSTGLGIRLIDDEAFEWTLAAGPSLRVFQKSDRGSTETAPGVRISNDLAWNISETATLANDTEIRLDRERSEIENETSLTLQIIDSLAGKFSFIANYRSPVPDDTEELDTTTKASLIYGF
ncbi:DUF481 domain-containing protein [Pelagibius litoralis]|uniref:DUF481 domain-containing protein n=1 Tax=Pelagibius litoralis TaxID=374515 RepID=A0A967C6J3_9PROT|nr:DUF481 domain-containing protein [Pelagibius litoralis]NIA67497.1 DUF481 domain-containing protein [Pelagibius litoralis]